VSVEGVMVDFLDQCRVGKRVPRFKRIAQNLSPACPPFKFKKKFLSGQHKHVTHPTFIIKIFERVSRFKLKWWAT
jgi:hypothetical protein